MAIVILEEGEEAVCDHCHREMDPGEHFSGPQMWHAHDWTCLHPKTFTCPTCYQAGRHKPCPACGCETEYC